MLAASPDGAWPGDVSLVTPDDVDVHLADDIADGRDVDFVGVKGGTDPVGELSDVEADFAVASGGQLVQLGDGRVHLWDEDEPEEVGVVFEKQLSVSEAT